MWPTCTLPRPGVGTATPAPDVPLYPHLADQELQGGEGQGWGLAAGMRTVPARGWGAPSAPSCRGPFSTPAPAGSSGALSCLWAQGSRTVRAQCGVPGKRHDVCLVISALEKGKRGMFALPLADSALFTALAHPTPPAGLPLLVFTSSRPLEAPCLLFPGPQILTF